jgi:hypothetical protein
MKFWLEIIMSYEVWVQDILPQYYSYIKSAMRKDYEIWEIDRNRDVFEDKWFVQEGINRITVNDPKYPDRKITIKLAFKSEQHYLLWVLK